jgi:hypothetical protein
MPAGMVARGRLRDLMVTSSQAERAAFFAQPHWEATYNQMLEEMHR